MCSDASVGATKFVCANTTPGAPPLLPGIELYLANEVTPLWQATEAALDTAQLPPPYWAFAWAGGQALARYLLDHPETVAGSDVLDVGAGSGLVAIAAMKAGAHSATAAEIDPFAAAAIGLNAARNDVAVAVETNDLIGRTSTPWTVVLVGDMCYELCLAERLVVWLRALSCSGTTVLLGDPGRAYLPKGGLAALARYDVPTPRDLEDRPIRETVVWRVIPR